MEIHKAVATEMAAVFKDTVVGVKSGEKEQLRKGRDASWVQDAWMHDVRDTGARCQFHAATSRKMSRKAQVYAGGLFSVGFLGGILMQIPLVFPFVLAGGGILLKLIRDHKTKVILNIMGWENIRVSTFEASRLSWVVQKLLEHFNRLKPPPFGDPDDDVRTEYEARRLAIERVFGLLAWLGRQSTPKAVNRPHVQAWRQKILNLAEYVENGLRDNPTIDFVLSI